MKNQTRYWWKTIASFLLVLFIIPLGHALMIMMEHLIIPTVLHYTVFAIGGAGLLMAIIGVLVRNGMQQTLWGLFGGLLFWTGWVEFLFMYYANRYGIQPEMLNGEVITRPEYLIMPASFGFWAIFMVLYLFSVKIDCNFVNWCQAVLFRGKRSEIVARPMTRHTSIVTFMELNMMLWGCYLLPVFCYDSNFLGDHHPVTMLIGMGCLVGSVFMFHRQLRLASWGVNIRMAIATVVVLWTSVEILGRMDFFSEVWVDPLGHSTEMIMILAVFVILAIYLQYIASKKRQKTVPQFPR